MCELLPASEGDREEDERTSEWEEKVWLPAVGRAHESQDGHEGEIPAALHPHVAHQCVESYQAHQQGGGLCEKPHREKRVGDHEGKRNHHVSSHLLLVGNQADQLVGHDQHADAPEGDVEREEIEEAGQGVDVEEPEEPDVDVVEEVAVAVRNGHYASEGIVRFVRANIAGDEDVGGPKDDQTYLNQDGREKQDVLGNRLSKRLSADTRREQPLSVLFMLDR